MSTDHLTVPLMEFHKQQGEPHYHDNNLTWAHTPATFELSSVKHKISIFLHLSCEHHIPQIYKDYLHLKKKKEMKKE